MNQKNPVGATSEELAALLATGGLGAVIAHQDKNYPRPNLSGVHPLHGMKTVALDGTERRFTPGLATIRRRDIAKASRANYVNPRAKLKAETRELRKRAAKIGVKLSKSEEKGALLILKAIR